MTTIPESLIEIREHEEPGYLPLIDYQSWRVALINYTADYLPEKIDQMQKHNETDEVFVLLEGQAVLFLGEGGDTVTALHPQVMESKKMYNVKRGAWHCAVLSRDASILLVENCDTGTANSDYWPLTTEMRQLIVETARHEQPVWWS